LLLRKVSYLTEDKSLLKHLEPEESFVMLKDDNDGVFRYINKDNKTVFEKYEPNN